MVTTRKWPILAALFLWISLLVACTGASGEAVQNTRTINPTRTESPPPTVAAPTENVDIQAATASSEEVEMAGMEITTEEAQMAAAADFAETVSATSEPLAPEPVEVTFFTPAQQEGPYYTVEKPADRDHDLVMLAGATAPPAGEVLEFGGTVYGADGYPVEGAVIEIWQTDASGVYLHPNDPGTANRDRNFQFYGEAQTDVNGRYNFRTILPGLYEPRPRHIHVKVRLDGREILTTQFYFAGEIDLQGAEALMLIDARPGEDDMGNTILQGQRDIFLNIDTNGG